jgi:YVTN family beta-propeller protein
VERWSVSSHFRPKSTKETAAVVALAIAVVAVMLVSSFDGAIAAGGGSGSRLQTNVTSPSLALSPTSGPVGTTVTATGAGFAENSSVTVTFNAGTVCALTSDSTGAFSCTFVLPASPQGTYTVIATDASENTASATFEVTTPSVAISPTSGPPGTAITPSVAGLAPSTAYELCFDTVQGTASDYCTTFTTDETGSYSTPFDSPSGLAANAYYVDAFEEVSGDYIASASSGFTATTPSISLSSTSGPDGTVVMVTGDGFDGSDGFVAITEGDQTLATCSASDQMIEEGCMFDVPSLESGSYTITATGSSGLETDVATASFEVTTPSITLAETSGPVGAMVTLTGGGFVSSDTSLTISSSPSGAVANPSCAASDQAITTCSFTVAPEASGSYSISVAGSGGPNDAATAVSMFTVTTPSITLAETSGPVGALVTISGGGFYSADTSLVISSHPSSPALVSSPSCTANDQTISSCSFIVAAGATGSYSIMLTGTGGPNDVATASTMFLVTTPSITLVQTSGPVGATVMITGGGFYSGDTSLTISSSPGGAVASPSCQANDQTISSCAFVVAPVSIGPYTIQVTGSGGAQDSATAPFMVTTPMITLSPATGPNGAFVSASGTGFTPYVGITFSIASGGLISSASSCSVSATQSYSGCTFTVTGTPATTYAVTATGADGSFDSASTSFTITALAPPAGGILFAKLPLPVGLAVNSTGFLATEFNDCTTLFSISSTGTVSTFATAPDLDGACEEAYPAISTGFAFFARGEVFLTQGPYVFEVGSHGGSMSLFATIPAFGTNPDQPTGITFDTVGTFGFLMVLSGGPAGTIVTVSSTGTPTTIGSVGHPVEGPTVAPLTFGADGGDLLVGTGAGNTLIAVSPGGGVAAVSSWPGAWSVSTVPATTCSFDGTDPYFVADESAGAVYAFSASRLSGLAGDALVTSDSTPSPSGIAQVVPSGSASSFSASADLLPGSMYAFCPVFGVEAVIPSIGIDPYEMGYDPLNGLMYSSDHASNLVYLFNSASTIVGTITVGLHPAGIAYDPANREMMVANTGSNSVTFINAKTNVVIGSVAVGHSPQGLAYDLYNFEVYVANEGSNSLSLISPFNHVVATIPTGTAPFGVAFNPLPLFIGSIYTANMGGTVTILTGFRETMLKLPCAAANLAEDFANGAMYVDDFGCSQVTLVLGTKIVTSIAVGADPFGVAFDPKTGFMYVSNTGSGTMSVLNGTKIALTVFLGSVPYGAGVTYDPANGLVYVAGGDPRATTGGDT